VSFSVRYIKKVSKRQDRLMSFFDVFDLCRFSTFLSFIKNLMLKPEIFDIEMIETNGITGNE